MSTTTPPAASILVVDMARLLDESPAGVAASAALVAKYEAAKAQFEKMRDMGTSTSGKQKAEQAAAEFQQVAITEIERERASLGQGAVEQILPVIEAVRAERGAAVVLDTRQALAFAGGLDVTGLVLQRLRDAR